MRCLIEQKILQPALAALARIAPARTPKTILQGVLIEANGGQVTLTAYDLEVALRMTLEAHVVDSGEIVLPAKLLSDLVRRLPEGPIDIATIPPYHLNASLDSGTTHMELNARDAVEFPTLPDMVGIEPVEIPAKAIVQAIKAVAYAAAKQDQVRRILDGVHVRCEDGRLVWTATDGLRLARMAQKLGRDLPIRFTVPRRGLSELLRLLEDEEDTTVQVYQSANYVMFAWGNVRLYALLYQAEYHDVTRVIPTEFIAECMVERDRLEQAVERAMILAENEHHSVTMDLSDGALHMTSRARDRGQAREEVPILESSGEKVRVTLNARFMLEMLQAMEGATVRMRFAGRSRPVAFHDDDDHLHLISAILTND
ncbi:DNA polymerase III subunit beta [Alicyclobacillus acidocaldarius]|uniref:Beta sliding clamp n=1 Tax=Alicyclobacillus acidocaldarius (strain Tc-4-1) TaxID=1048834 RepID=F8IH35_ALIAT|nr:DNA polymerase III subunit beta [Alicyclobacillus acidocaldarius]AEJ44389.1 DNA polymerase III, beta subunit [Alicyclobacillus acidocaldarius subsp. acidocaldarius Tc-4-1]